MLNLNGVKLVKRMFAMIAEIENARFVENRDVFNVYQIVETATIVQTKYAEIVEHHMIEIIAKIV